MIARVVLLLAAVRGEEASVDLAQTVVMINAGELENNFYAGEHGGSTSAERVKGCISDKIDAINNEGPMSFKADLLVDVAACCLPDPPEIFPGCVVGMEEAYKKMHEATEDSEMQNNVVPLLAKYASSLKAEL